MTKKLKDVSEFIVDSEHKTPQTQEKGYPYVRTNNISNGHLFLDEADCVDEERYKEWTQRATPQPGDIIVSREAPVGNIGMISEKKKVCLGQRTVLIRPDIGEIDPQYLKYYLLSHKVQSRFDALSGGATVPHLNMADLRDFKLTHLPNIEKQKRIGSVLSTFDDLIKNNNQRIEILEEMAETIYREWFVNFNFPSSKDVAMKNSEIGYIPDKFKVKKLKEVVDLQSGYGFKSENYEEEGRYEVVTIGNVQNKVFDPNCDNSISELPNRLKDYHYLFTGDILLSLTGNVGRVCFVYGENYLLNQRVGKLIPQKDNLREFTYLLFRQETVRSQLENIATGAAQQNLSLRNTRNMKIKVPNKELLKKFSAKVEPMFDMIFSLYKRNEILEQIRGLLLPRLISGEIEV